MQPSERKCIVCGTQTANHAYCDNCLKPNPQADGSNPKRVLANSLRDAERHVGLI